MIALLSRHIARLVVTLLNVSFLIFAVMDLLPGDPAVCEQDPSPGTQVRRGTSVHVVVSKSC